MKSLKEDYEECPFGCVFDMKRLVGDCRIPWHDRCAMNKRRNNNNERAQHIGECNSIEGSI